MQKKCSFCFRNNINYKQGNFFIMTFSKELDNTNNLKILDSNKKWLCDIHYPIFFKYKMLTWEDAKKNVLNKINN